MALNDAILYYSLDDADNDMSGNPQDLSGNGNHGTNNGATTGATGVINEGFSISGTSNRLTLPSLGSYTGAISVNVWVKVSSANNYFLYSLNTGDNHVLSLGLSNNGKIGIYDGVWRESTATTPTGSLAMITWVFDGVSSFDVYVNGSVADSGVTYGGTVDLSGTPEINRSGQADFSGDFDEVGIWNRQLSSSEISDLYNSGNGFNPYGLTTPTVTTTAPTNITKTTADSGGNVTADGGASVTARGVAWSTSTNPTTADNTTSDGTGTGSYSSSITGLSANTTYHVRAYATNSQGTAYGADEEFTTLSQIQTGIKITGSSSYPVKIKDCKFTSLVTGIEGGAIADLIVSENFFRNCFTGINTTNSPGSGYIISNNSIQYDNENSIGIIFGGNGVNITGNSIFCGIGIKDNGQADEGTTIAANNIEGGDIEIDGDEVFVVGNNCFGDITLQSNSTQCIVVSNYLYGFGASITDNGTSNTTTPNYFQ